MTHCPICFEWVGNEPHSHPLPEGMTPIPISVWEDGFEKELAKQVAAAEARGRQQVAEELEAYAENYPADVFTPDGTSRDAVAGSAMRHAYLNAARIARKDTAE